MPRGGSCVAPREFWNGLAVSAVALIVGAASVLAAEEVRAAAADIGGTLTGAVTEDSLSLTSATGRLTATDPDEGDEGFKPQTGSETLYGTFDLTTDGLWTYRLRNEDPDTNALAEGEKAEERLAVQSADGTGATVVIEVTGRNDPPVAAPDTARLAPGGTVDISVLANDSDPDNDRADLTPVLVGEPASGVATVNPDGTVTFEHDGSDVATGGFDYMVTDPDGAASDAVSVTVTVGASSAPPVASADSARVDEGAAVEIAVLENDTDPDGDAQDLTPVLIDAPANGTAAVNADGTVAYTHDGSETASDSFTYKVVDPDGEESGAATVAITVSAVNDPPDAVADHALVKRGGSLEVSVLANDTDPDNETAALTPVLVEAPANGSAAVNPVGTVSYTHDGSETSSDSFTYKVVDPDGAASAVALVSVTVGAANSPPVAAADSAAVEEGGAVRIDVLANDADTDNMSAELTAILVDAPAYGTATVDEGAVIYTHDGSETSSDRFTYKAVDEEGGESAPAAVAIVISPVNDPPVAVADRAIVTEGGSVTIAVLANDSDPDNRTEELTPVLTGEPVNGVAAVNPDGTVTYEHDDTKGTADGGFSYRVTDPDAEASAAVFVTVTVEAENEPPVAAADSATVAEGDSVVIAVLANDSDADDAASELAAVLVEAPLHGTAVANADGTVTYAHDGSETASDRFTYKARDSDEAESDAASVTIAVTPVNDAPTATADSASAPRGGSIRIAVLANDTDPDNETDELTPILVGAVANGMATVSKDGAIFYAHDGTSTATGGFSYKVVDPSGASSAPAAVDITILWNEPAAITGDLAGAVREDDTTGSRIAGRLRAADPDGEDDSFAAETDKETVYGSFTIAANGAWTYRLRNDDPETDALAEGGPQGIDRIAVRAADGTSAHLEITVKGANDAPVFAESSGAPRRVREDAEAGYPIGPPMAAHDPDEGDVLSWSLEGADTIPFAIDTRGGQLRTRAHVLLDHEARSTYAPTVVVVDRHGARAETTVAIAVTDVDEPLTATGTVTAVLVEGGAAVTLDLSTAFHDPEEGDTPASRTYEAAFPAAGVPQVARVVAVAQPSDGALTVTIEPVAAGTAHLAVTALTAGEREAEQLVAVTVRPAASEGEPLPAMTVRPGMARLAVGRSGGAKVVTLDVAADALPPGRELTLVLPDDVPDGLKVTVRAASPGVVAADNRFGLGAEPQDRTVMDVTVSADVAVERLCLPVTENLRAEAGDRPLVLLHFERRWEVVPGSGPSVDGSLVCATDIAVFSPFAVAYSRLESPAEPVGRSDRGDRVILAELTRTTAASILEAAAARLEQAASERPRGRRIGAGRTTPDAALEAQARKADRRGMDWRAILGRSSFMLPGSRPAGAGALSVWGTGDYRRVSGHDRGAAWRGRVLGAHVGIDAPVREGLLAGLALSWLEAAFEYDGGPGSGGSSGAYESVTASVLPYVGWSSPEGLGLWAAAGYGLGTVAHGGADGGERLTSGSAFGVAGAGGRAAIASSGGPGGAGELSLALKGEVWRARSELEGLPGSEGGLGVDVNRFRVALAGAHAAVQPSDIRQTTSLEVGLRRDGGDGGSAAGLEIRGGLRREDSSRGLTAEIMGRTLLAHEDAGAAWGASATLDYAPPTDGLTLRVAPSVGHLGQAVAPLWERRLQGAPNTGAVRTARFETEIGYGMSAPSGSGSLTPYAGLSLAREGARRYGLGLRFEPGETVTLTLESFRREPGVRDSESGFVLRVAARR